MRRSAALFLALAATLSRPAIAQETPLAFTGARILTVSRGEIARGTLVVHHGKILAVGADATVPAGATVRDVAGRVLMPGLVDTHSHVGQVAGADSSAPIQPDVRALDGVNVRHSGIQKAQAGGITTANVMPGSGHLLSGQTVYLKLRDGSTLDDLAIRWADGTIAGGMKMANGTNSRHDPPFPGTRAKSASLVREQYVVPNLLDQHHLIVDDGVLPITLEMREEVFNMLPANVVPNYPGTYLWSYLKKGVVHKKDQRLSYIGPVILATRGQPTEMKFVNLLGKTVETNVLAYKYSTDQTLHWAEPLHGEDNMANHMAGYPAPGDPGSQNYDGPIPAVVHLHGGEVPPQLDGGPDAWFTSDGQYQGHAYYSKAGALGNEAIYRYPNSQEGALIWFHDHTLGATRLNVYCGLAGAYLIADPNDILLATLPTLFPLVIQDRMFDTNGQLFFPSDSAGGVLWTPNPEHPYWVPEFVGDTIVVNGKTWPFMNVEPKR